MRRKQRASHATQNAAKQVVYAAYWELPTAELVGKALKSRCLCVSVLSCQVSWCKVELELANAKAIKPAQPGSRLAAQPPPSLTVAALNLRLHLDPKTRQQEMLAASVVYLSGGWVGRV